MKNLKETKALNLQRRRRKLAELLEKERLEHTVSNVYTLGSQNGVLRMGGLCDGYPKM